MSLHEREIALLREKSAVKIQAVFRGFAKRYTYNVMDCVRRCLHGGGPLYYKDGSIFDKSIVADFLYSSPLVEGHSGNHVHGETEALPWGYHYIQRRTGTGRFYGDGDGRAPCFMLKRLRKYRAAKADRRWTHDIKSAVPDLPMEYYVTLQSQQGSNGVRLTHAGGSVVLFDTPDPVFFAFRRWLSKRTMGNKWRIGPTRKVAKAVQDEFKFKLERPPLASLPPGAVPVPEHYEHPQIKWRGLGGGGVKTFHPNIETQLREQKLQKDLRLENALSTALKRSADAGHLKRASARTQTRIIKRAKIAGLEVGIHRCMSTYRAIRDERPMWSSDGDVVQIAPLVDAKIYHADNRVVLEGRRVTLTYGMHSSHMQRHGHHAPGWWPGRVLTNRSGFGVTVMTGGATLNVVTERDKSLAEFAAVGNMKISKWHEHFFKTAPGVCYEMMLNILGFCTALPKTFSFKSNYTTMW